ncbi:MAG: hypothetical protein U0787_23405 [Polyangia bacterium]
MHVGCSGDIGPPESHVRNRHRQGHRLIEALTAEAAEEYLGSRETELLTAAETLRSGPPK